MIAPAASTDRHRMRACHSSQSDAANPNHLPEHHLWTLRKDGRRVEARTRLGRGKRR